MLSYVLPVVYGVLVALLFSLAVFIHEFGHFIAARLLGLRADVFSIGFGPALWKKKIGNTVYKICAIPFGGYVSLPQLDPAGMQKIQGTSETEEGEQLSDVAAWKKIIVAFAGPFGNVLLAVILAFAISFAPKGAVGGPGTCVGAVLPDSPAYRAGLRMGDTIESVNGVAVEAWSDIRIESMLSGDRNESEVKVITAEGDASTLRIPLTTNNVFGVKMIEGIYPKSNCVISNLVSGGVAEQTGLKTGDIFVTLNGRPVMGCMHLTLAIRKNGEKPMKFGVEREGKIHEFTLVPRYDERYKTFVIGAMLATQSVAVQSWMMYRNPWKQVLWDAQSVLRVLQALVAPRQKGERKVVAEQIGGPITIVAGLYRSVRSSFWDAWGFLRMICINLAILNLIPLPVLDGGHIVFALYEIIARRKPNRKVVSVLVNGFAFLLIGLMLLLVYRDFVLQSKMTKAMRSAETSENTSTNTAKAAQSEKR